MLGHFLLIFNMSGNLRRVGYGALSYLHIHRDVLAVCGRLQEE